MKNIVILLFIVVATACSSQKNHGSIRPDFNDNGKAESALVKTYQCESIEYENWEQDDKEDSSLTVCLINSKLTNYLQKSNYQGTLTDIAKQVKASLKHPESYNSYYIIFVTRSGSGVYEASSHSLGTEISSSEL